MHASNERLSSTQLAALHPVQSHDSTRSESSALRQGLAEASSLFLLTGMCCSACDMTPEGKGPHAAFSLILILGVFELGSFFFLQRIFTLCLSRSGILSRTGKDAGVITAVVMVQNTP